MKRLHKSLFIAVFENEGLESDTNCQKRHFNETLHLPLCSSWTDMEMKYDISIRATKITQSKLRLEGPWMITLQTSFMCKGPQGNVSLVISKLLAK